jgi:tetratricopeptide (TPR) repeat protein
MKHHPQPISSGLGLPEHFSAPFDLQYKSIPSFPQLFRVVIRMIAILLLQLSLVVPASAQKNKQTLENRILLRQAMLDIDRLQYDKAISKLLLLRMTEEVQPNVAYLLGRSYLYSNRLRSIEKAVFYLAKASEHASDKYEEWDLDERNAPMEVFYHLGKAQEKFGLYEAAAESYESFLAHLSDDKNIQRSKMYGLIEQTVLDCQFAALNAPIIELEENLLVQRE